MSEFAVLCPTSQWVESTLAGLTLDQKIGQLLLPFMGTRDLDKEIAANLGDIEPAGVHILGGTMAECQAASEYLQQRYPVPLILSADLENGAGRTLEGATSFPETMSLGATDSEELAFMTGRAAAVEGRACGVHWTFGPVVDLNLNPNNPITNTRAFGDDPDRVGRLAVAVIRGMQANGLAATAKHFPGDGLDDRDHHLCTTINPLSMDDWYALSGRMFRKAIDAGVWAIMPGHISLPAWDPGGGAHPSSAPPATLSRRLITGLLREKMSFAGVVVTDAMNMAGALAWGPAEEILPQAIDAGCDVMLFCSARSDFDILKRAVQGRRLTEGRIDQSVRRILALKEALGLHADRGLRPL